MDEEQKKLKLKAVDINTESLKLYVTLAVGCTAGLIAYHNSNNIIHDETWFYISISFLILTAITGLATLNSFISSIDEGIVDVNKKLPMRLNITSIVFFALGLMSAGAYFKMSDKKIEQTKGVSQSGISIQGENIFIGNDVKTRIKIVKDSNGKITEISIRDEK